MVASCPWYVCLLPRVRQRVSCATSGRPQAHSLVLVSQAKPSNRVGARAVLTLKKVVGDGSAWLVSKEGTDIILLGPSTNALAMIPSVTTIAIERSFARIARTDLT